MTTTPAEDLRGSPAGATETGAYPVVALGEAGTAVLLVRWADNYPDNYPERLMVIRCGPWWVTPHGHPVEFSALLAQGWHMGTVLHGRITAANTRTLHGTPLEGAGDDDQATDEA